MKNGMLLLTASAFALSLSAQPGFADPAQSGASTQGIEVITVTAERRAQSVMSVPASIQAVTGAQLRKTGIKDMTSLQMSTPSFLPDTNNGFVQVYIRGIGNGIFVGADPSVATFIDGVPQIYGMMIGNLTDVKRVEILKGAQGGLYGRNATGGVINIITRKPSTDKLMGNLHLSYGEKHTLEASGYLNVPITNQLAWSVAVDRESHSPYIKNTAPATPYSAANFPVGSYHGTPQQTADYFNAVQSPPKMDYGDLWAVRSKLLYAPTDDFTFTLEGAYANKNDTSSGQFVTTTPAYTAAALAGLFHAAGITANIPASTIHGASGEWTAGVGVDNYSHIQDISLSGTAVWNGPGFNLTSITAYRNMRNQLSGDGATTTVPFIPLTVTGDRNYFYQELRAVSTFSGPLKLLGGVTYLDNHVNLDTETYFLSWAAPYGSSVVQQKITNWSVYLQAGYDLTDRLNLTASGRFIHEKNKALFTAPIVSGTSSTEQKFVPSVTLSYRLDGGTVYVRWARGFKTGGVNLTTAPVYFPSPSDGSVFGPEVVDTYEGGIKDSFFDNRVRVTGAVFYNDYSNLQVEDRPSANPSPIVTAVINAKSARTWGIEGSVDWRIIDPLTVGANVGYLNAKYTNFQLASGGVLAPFNRNGDQMPDAPKWQLSLHADVNQPINADYRFVGNVLASYISDVIYNYSAVPGYLPDNVGPSHWLVNARVGVTTSNGRYGLYLSAQNLLDQQYYVGGVSSAFGNLLNYGKPRIISAEFDVNF